MFDSPRNTIADNTAENNGPFDGIGLIGNSDDNFVRNNQSNDNRSLNRLPNGRNGPCGPFQGGGAGSGGVGRPAQNIGMRIEGPGANNNVVQDNGVDNNLLDGISVHGHVCAPPPGSTVGQPQPENAGNVVRNNTVTNNGTGIASSDRDPSASPSARRRTRRFRGTRSPATSATGSSSRPCPATTTWVRTSSTTTGATDHRPGPLHHLPARLVQPQRSRPVQRPPRAESGLDRQPARREPGAGNGHHDGHDDNPDCDNNQWRGNRFVTVNQPCVAGAGGNGKVPPGLANAAERPNHDAGGNSEGAPLGQRRGRP